MEANRVLGHEKSEEDRWEREWRDAEELPTEEGFQIFVVQAFARLDGDPEGRARYQAWILSNHLLNLEDLRSLASENTGDLGNAPNQHGMPPPQAETDDQDSDEEALPLSSPSQVQRSCQHVFDYRAGAVQCVVCTLRTEGDIYAQPRAREQL